MNERERILDLVKQGILSTEEGLDLLEGLAKKEDIKSEKKEFDEVEKTSVKKTKNYDFGKIVEKELSGLDQEIEQGLESLDEEIDRISDEVENAVDEEVQSELEDELEALANEVNEYSAELDQLNAELADVKSELADRKDELHSLKEEVEEGKKEEIDDLKLEIKGLQEELRLVQKIDEVDNTDEVNQLKKEISDLEKELNELETFDDKESREKIEQLEKEVDHLQKEVAKRQEEKAEIMKKLHTSKMRQWTTRAKQVSERLEIPEEWKTEASEAFSKAGEQIEITGKDLGGFIRKTIESAKGALDNVEWTDMNIRVPKLASTEFEHEWLFEDSSATILDFKNANGNIRFEPSINENIKVSAKIKLYGKMEEETPMEAFEARSIIEEDEDKLTFHVPNKRIQADLVVYLPDRTYDYMAVKLLNGSVNFNKFKAKDVYVKSTNGDIKLNKLEATMLETKGTNGNVVITDAELLDLLVSTVNGDVRLKGKIQSSDLSTTNGEIRATFYGNELTRLKATSVNGNVKIAIPKDIDVEGEAKTVFGKVKSRLSDTSDTEEKSNKKNKLVFHRLNNGQALQLLARTTSGNVLLKDTE